MASTRVIAKFQCKEFIKCMYLDLAGHIRVRLRVLTVQFIIVLIMFYHRSIKLLHSFWWFTMTCKASLWCILRWISLFVCSKPHSHSRFQRSYVWIQVIAIKKAKSSRRVYLRPVYVKIKSTLSVLKSWKHGLYSYVITDVHTRPILLVCVYDMFFL